MFKNIIYLFISIIFSFKVLGDTETSDLKRFAYSKQWLNLLYYNKTLSGYSSRAQQDKFFLSDKGMNDPYAELAETIEVFNGKLSRHHYAQGPICQFPARYKILSRFINKREKVNCPDFDEWYKGIDAGQMYIVFSSAYPSNPASMFGHTFLRFDRKSYKKSKEGESLLGYSIGFMANTQDDNAFMYTYKGITGGYLNLLEIKPYYINIGIYNNGDKRDLWEYPINLNTDEHELLLRHIWEISQTTGFKYYFFDENCATYIQYLLEAIKPDLNFKSKNEIFVTPINVLNEIVSQNSTDIAFRGSLDKKFFERINLLDSNEKKIFKEAKDDLNALEKVQAVRVLDALIDYWSIINYQKNTMLSEKEKSLMMATLQKRSKVSDKSIDVETKIRKQNEKYAPHLGHKLSNFSIGVGKENVYISSRYGFHGFKDPPLGHDNKSYVEFMDLKAIYKKQKAYLNEITIADILSLQDFIFLYPNFSWNINVNLTSSNNNSIDTTSISGGVGASQIVANLTLVELIKIKNSFNFEDNTNNLFPILHLKLKSIFLDNFHFVYNGELELDTNLNMENSVSVNYFSKKYLVGLKYDHIGKRENGVGIFINWYY